MLNLLFYKMRIDIYFTKLFSSNANVTWGNKLVKKRKRSRLKPFIYISSALYIISWKIIDNNLFTTCRFPSGQCSCTSFSIHFYLHLILIVDLYESNQYVLSFHEVKNNLSLVWQFFFDKFAKQTAASWYTNFQ